MIRGLAEELDKWMADQGDLGDETEWNAKERQGSGGKKRKSAAEREASKKKSKA